jgi:hypothetical protein
MGRPLPLSLDLRVNASSLYQLLPAAHEGPVIIGIQGVPIRRSGAGDLSCRRIDQRGNNEVGKSASLSLVLLGMVALSLPLAAWLTAPLLLS